MRDLGRVSIIFAVVLIAIEINAQNTDYPYFIPYDVTAKLSEQLFMGDYVGKVVSESPGHFRRYPDCVAQVYPVDDNKFTIKFMEKFDCRSDDYATITGLKIDNMVVFNNESAKGMIVNDSLTGQLFFDGRWHEFGLKKTMRQSPTEGENAPENAIVLFDGSDYDEWIGYEDAAIKWEIVNGDQMEILPVKHHTYPKNSIFTKRKFSDLFLHLEFRLPLMPESSGQYRANSGIIFNDVCEVQILDSYGLEGKWRDCGALYRISPPKVNACGPPLTWQTYDIIYHAPKYDKQGQRIENGEITVYHNGKRIHYKYPLKRGPEKLENGAVSFTTNIEFQDHWYVLWFRNVWVIDLTKSNMLPKYISQLE
ncbi:MAG: DUF1080 domain-containing protein [Bacteroidales bacterium]